MSGHRVELHVSFSVGDTTGLEDAETVRCLIEELADDGGCVEELASGFKVWRGTWDGNDWPQPRHPKAGAPFLAGEVVVVDAPVAAFHGMTGTVAEFDGETVWVTMKEYSRIRGGFADMPFPMRFFPEELRHA